MLSSAVCLRSGRSPVLRSKIHEARHHAFIYLEDDGYAVECPEIHTTTQGDSLDVAISNSKEAVALPLEDGPAECRLVDHPAILVMLKLEPR